MWWITATRFCALWATPKGEAVKNFLLSPVSNSVLIASALLFALLSWLGSGAGSDVTGLSLAGGTTNFSAVAADSVTATNITATNISGATSGASMTASVSISTPLLYVEGVAASGPVRFGTASGVTTGTLIAHGLGTTPTAVILTVDTPAVTFTNTLGVGPTNATSFTVYIPGGATVSLDWMAGR
jgi:hypothetical protein